MIKHISTAICFAATCSMALAQQQVAATGAVKGAVLVNHGTGFARVGANTPLAPGDRLMAQAGGRTEIVYSDGCVVKVRPGRTVTIGDTSPCRVADATPPADAGAGAGVSAGTYAAGAGLVAAGIIPGIILAGRGGGGGIFLPPRPISP